MNFLSQQKKGQNLLMVVYYGRPFISKLVHHRWVNIDRIFCYRSFRMRVYASFVHLYVRMYFKPFFFIIGSSQTYILTGTFYAFYNTRVSALDARMYTRFSMRIYTHTKYAYTHILNTLNISYDINRLMCPK